MWRRSPSSRSERSHWLAEYTRLRAPVRLGDDHITLRYERLGETVLIDIPLPEEVGS